MDFKRLFLGMFRNFLPKSRGWGEQRLDSVSCWVNPRLYVGRSRWARDSRQSCGSAWVPPFPPVVSLRSSPLTLPPRSNTSLSVTCRGSCPRRPLGGALPRSIPLGFAAGGGEGGSELWSPILLIWGAGGEGGGKPRYRASGCGVESWNHMRLT